MLRHLALTTCLAVGWVASLALVARGAALEKLEGNEA
jgi:hypothetical protein